MMSVPAWVAIPAALLMIVSGILTLIGSLGLLRLRTFYERMHAPTLGMTMGVFCMVLAS
ncbi:MAG TPA: monovalent cation/H(+) antiporter subunit G, partial [Castellaniella sp.]|nr:monovalent cation/H(+) antiporter subunit G [Castellaniella sp.]